jgi:hypothetical protein
MSKYKDKNNPFGLLCGLGYDKKDIMKLATGVSLDEMGNEVEDEDEEVIERRSVSTDMYVIKNANLRSFKKVPDGYTLSILPLGDGVAVCYKDEPIGTLDPEAARALKDKYLYDDKLTLTGCKHSGIHNRKGEPLISIWEDGDYSDLDCGYII